MIVNSEKVVALTKGAIRKLVDRRKQDARTFGTDNSRYCYAVWLRHLVHAHKFGFNQINSVVAELGPGESIGIGLAALLTGSRKYYALDVHTYWNTERNLMVFDKLVELFRNRTDIPDNHEFPKVYPLLDDYRFPSQILNDNLMNQMLTEDRIIHLRSAIKNMDRNSSDEIQFFVPWEKNTEIETGSLDYIFSQAVLQYVDNIDSTYEKMNSLLREGAMMSHCIDFSSHGMTKSWNGQWLYSDAEWKFLNGNKKVILNREPKSAHLLTNANNGFQILTTKDLKKEIEFPKTQFHKKYSSLSETDAGTAVSFIVSRKN
jgi:hypothetical protein